MDKIVCVGKNYEEHAKELGDAVPEKPVLFLKPPSVLRVVEAWGQTITLRVPENRGELHYECEIVLKLKAGGENIPDSKAAGCVESVSLGLDMTLRTLQAQLKKLGHPWTTSKVFPDAAVVGPQIPIKEFANYLEQPFSFSLNGAIRQQGRGVEMILNPAEIISYVSSCFPLCAGDLIFTGTPAGVGEVKAGDVASIKWQEKEFSVCWEELDESSKRQLLKSPAGKVQFAEGYDYKKLRT